MTQHLLAAREDVFPNYTIEGFRQAFGRSFRLVQEVPVEDSLRTLFLFERT